MKKKNLKFIIIFLALLFGGFFGGAGRSEAVPSITGVSGTISHDLNITVNGSGFGVKNPVAPLKWDPIDGNYGSIVEGAVVPSGDGNPWGDLSSVSMNPATFTLQNSRGKFTVKYSNRTQLTTPLGTGGAGNAVVGRANFSAAVGGKLYISYWLNSQQNVDILTTTQSFKFMRLTENGNWGDDNNTSSAFIWAPTGQQAYDWATGFHINAWVTWSGQANVWTRNEITVDNTSNPKPELTLMVDNALLANLISSNGGESCNSGGCTYGSLTSDIVGIYSLGADWSNWDTGADGPAPRLDWGEIYVDNTLARVEICNASTKAVSNHCEIQIPQATWNDEQLQININQGSFADYSSQYLYVVDANGDTNVNGYQVTFQGSGDDTTPPAAPSGLSVI